MANDYIEYLSANVLNDGQTASQVSYRTLSRALRVHANRAKQMLYDFHTTQIKKKPDSLHATYLITGFQSVSPPQPEDAVPDQSSPAHQEPASYRATSLLLVDQDNLDAAKSTFDQLVSIHVYSLQPTRINDLHVLTECNRAIMATALGEDLLATYKQYGVIQNPQVKRRPMRAQPPAQTSTTSKSEAQPAKSIFPSTKTAAKPLSKTTTTSSKTTPDSSQPSTQTSAKPAAAAGAAATKAAPLKREGSSLFKAFAKARPKTQSQATGTSAEASPAADLVANEDDAMNGLSDEEADDEDTAMLDDGAITETGAKSKKEREDELRRMMDMEDEPMADVPANTGAAEASENAEDEPDSKPEAQEKEEPEETVTVSDGRRRGRRRVMKKKTVQDEEGYLVTREEAAWESFSEEEPAPKKAKVSVAPTTAKAKKAAPKGQGNIMSFFSKK
ncbi:hypothetical protein M436DRAFT_50370 [Aureobasidium namibiae CBS 147.97]|uniref:DNA polymerase delta subunit 3 n=1 Tax=Aureobasidium namibiae CBS 147.97 TaxID=1043004 RepID=A0A074WFL1_9PEZI